jgi:hypothetical protein
MNKTKLYIWAIVAAIILAAIVIASGKSMVHADVSSTCPSNMPNGDVCLSGWAWSSNIGWLSFNSTDTNTGNGGSGMSTNAYGVFLATTTANPTIGTLSGYAWSSNIGWVSFNSNSCGDQAKVDLSAGSVTGWAQALSADGNGWDGCIELSGTNNNVTPPVTHAVSMDTSTGIFSGYAWGSDVVGWLQFNPTLSTGTIPPVTCTGCVPNPVDNSQALALTASYGSLTAQNDQSIDVPSGQTTTLNWNIKNMTSCSEIGSDWSNVTISNPISTGDIVGSVTGSGFVTLTTVGSPHVFTLSCIPYPKVFGVPRQDQAVTINVTDSGGHGGSNICIVPPNTITCNSTYNSSGSKIYPGSSCTSDISSVNCSFVCSSGRTLNNGSCVKSSLQEI